jgi:hypothetical protein
MCTCKQEEKVAEVERELNEAQFKVETAQGIFDTIVSRMNTELARFQVRAATCGQPAVIDTAAVQSASHLSAVGHWACGILFSAAYVGVDLLVFCCRVRWYWSYLASAA